MPPAEPGPSVSAAISASSATYQFGDELRGTLDARLPSVKSRDFILAQKVFPASLYFVDDNFIGNRKAAREAVLKPDSRSGALARTRTGMTWLVDGF